MLIRFFGPLQIASKTLAPKLLKRLTVHADEVVGARFVTVVFVSVHEPTGFYSSGPSKRRAIKPAKVHVVFFRFLFQTR